MADSNQKLTGTNRADWLLGSDGNDSISGARGSDYILGDPGDDTIDGCGGRDYIRGDSDDDLIDSGNGDDVILGDIGNDTIDGGWGDDSLAGGTGEDTFLFAGSSGNDTITDFSVYDSVLDLQWQENTISDYNELTIFTPLELRPGIKLKSRRAVRIVYAALDKYFLLPPQRIPRNITRNSIYNPNWGQ